MAILIEISDLGDPRRDRGVEPRSFLRAPKWLDGLADGLATTDAPGHVMSEKAAEEMTGFHVHRGAPALLKRRPLPSVQESARSVLVLEDIVDDTKVWCRRLHGAAGGEVGPVRARAAA